MIIECVVFKLKPYQKIDLEKAIRDLTKFFESKKGFVKRRVFFGAEEPNELVDLTYWSDIDSAKQFSDVFKNAPECSMFNNFVHSVIEKNYFTVDYQGGEETFLPQKEDDSILELVRFTVKQPDNHDMLVNVADEANKFLQKKAGYIGRSLSFSDAGERLDCVYWENIVVAKAAANGFMEAPETQRFIAEIVNIERFMHLKELSLGSPISILEDEKTKKSDKPSVLASKQLITVPSEMDESSLSTIALRLKYERSKRKEHADSEHISDSKKLREDVSAKASAKSKNPGRVSSFSGALVNAFSVKSYQKKSSQKRQIRP